MHIGVTARKGFQYPLVSVCPFLVDSPRNPTALFGSRKPIWPPDALMWVKSELGDIQNPDNLLAVFN
jgi:hypothetical protein